MSADEVVDVVGIGSGLVGFGVSAEDDGPERCAVVSAQVDVIPVERRPNNSSDARTLYESVPDEAHALISGKVFGLELDPGMYLACAIFGPLQRSCQSFSISPGDVIVVSVGFSVTNTLLVWDSAHDTWRPPEFEWTKRCCEAG